MKIGRKVLIQLFKYLTSNNSQIKLKVTICVLSIWTSFSIHILSIRARLHAMHIYYDIYTNIYVIF